jgi:hypothetical protein
MIGSQTLSSPGSKISLFGSAFCLLVLCCTDVVYTQTTAVIPDDATAHVRLISSESNGPTTSTSCSSGARSV